MGIAVILNSTGDSFNYLREKSAENYRRSADDENKIRRNPQICGANSCLYAIEKFALTLASTYPSR